MRLGQLARKLALRPAEIVEFLAINHIQVDEGSNTKLEDDHVTLIMTQFAPSLAEDVAKALLVEKETLVVEGHFEPLPIETALNGDEVVIEDIHLSPIWPRWGK